MRKSLDKDKIKILLLEGVHASAVENFRADGYTNVEKYLNGLDPTKKVDWSDPKNNVNTLTREKLFAQ